ncbi:mediator of RNA polymerase II transcription subunit 27-like [Zingiber officinale]|uniref:mediator of RNA polymerase II transcription subunit 27-like n=1 Tax=Zingiber officinale TaxID=94328 RepID=UPI001C4B76A7|nr:mediator of RNA polymerase II transcription subunit 27-like [Zingiber officinale]
MESGGEASTEAPPKQVALAMERLASAARKIADIRLGADRLLEAIFLATEGPQQSINKTVQLILSEETSMRQHFQDLSRLALDLLPSYFIFKSMQ